MISIKKPGFSLKKVPSISETQYENLEKLGITTTEELLGVNEAMSAQVDDKKYQLLEDAIYRKTYAAEFTKIIGSSTFLYSTRIFRELRTVHTNLYKNFIVQTWRICRANGIGALIHEDGIFNESNAGEFRYFYYKRLCSCYRFKNQLLLFSDVDNNKPFSINIFRGNYLFIDFL